MTFFEAIIMGLIQGITEFLPVSSSGHLAIFSNLLHINTDTNILFEVMLHVGTLTAIIFTFRTDIHHMLWEALRIIADLFFNLKTAVYNKIHESDEQRYRKILFNNYRKLVVMVLVSSVPTAVIGYLLRDIVSEMTKSLLAVGLGLFVTAILLLVIDYWNFGNKIPKNISLMHALCIGICQGIGVFPGISRSGITITAGLLCGFKKSFAVRYSFLMSIPAILGALILEIRDFNAPAMTFSLGAYYTAGMLVAAVSGFFAIKLTLVLVQKKKFRIFSCYCFLLGIIAIACNFLLS
jgi:undecaprenyl-diphosphatase